MDKRKAPAGRLSSVDIDKKLLRGHTNLGRKLWKTSPKGTNGGF
jgi:hypothetical protein